MQTNLCPIFDRLLKMTTINQSCPVAKQPSDLDSELAKLTGNLQQVQDTFLNHWTGDQLTKFLQDHLREHETLIQESKGKYFVIFQSPLLFASWAFIVFFEEKKRRSFSNKMHLADMCYLDPFCEHVYDNDAFEIHKKNGTTLALKKLSKVFKSRVSKQSIYTLYSFSLKLLLYGLLTPNCIVLWLLYCWLFCCSPFLSFACSF